MSGLLIDCFAGGGGASKGIELALNRPIDIAVNHDPEAIRIHKVNHPNTLHLTEDIFTVDLQKYVAGRPVDLMWASPDCTSHSKAKGGQPRHRENHKGGSGDRSLPAVDGKPPPLWPRHPGGKGERADHLQGRHHHYHPAERIQHQNLIVPPPRHSAEAGPGGPHENRTF